MDVILDAGVFDQLHQVSERFFFGFRRDQQLWRRFCFVASAVGRWDVSCGRCDFAHDVSEGFR